MEFEPDDVEIVDYKKTEASFELVAGSVWTGYSNGMFEALKDPDVLAGALISGGMKTVAEAHVRLIVGRRIMPFLDQFIYLKTREKLFGEQDERVILTEIRSIADQSGSVFVDAYSLTKKVMEKLKLIEDDFNKNHDRPFDLCFRALALEEGRYSIQAWITNFAEEKIAEYEFEKPEWLMER